MCKIKSTLITVALIVFISVVTYQKANGQNIPLPYVVNSAGGIISGTNIQIESNIGEPLTTFILNHSGSVSQGYLQPSLCGYDKTEQCDGFDNNCNGMADEFLDCSDSLEVTLYIEGIYSGNRTMKSTINSFTESDSITIQLAAPQSPYPILQIKQGIVMRSGLIKVLLDNVTGRSFYLVIRHRNSMEIWSKTPVSFDNRTVFFNFSN